MKCVLLTGLSGSGKTTLAYKLSSFLKAEQISSVILDGDIIRDGLNRDLKFSSDDRKENARRVAEVAKLFIAESIIPIISIIAPCHKDRMMMRDIIGYPNFSLVFVNCPLEICKSRDVKGLYAKVQKGIISDFTGISSAYEVPEDFDIMINTAVLNVNDSLTEILNSVFPSLKQIHNL